MDVKEGQRDRDNIFLKMKKGTVFLKKSYKQDRIFFWSIKNSG
jgi:hypothetical protein